MFVTQHNHFLPKYPEQECVSIIISRQKKPGPGIGTLPPGGGGCQRFAEPVLSPLLYNSNLLGTKGIFEAAKIMQNIGF